MPKRAWTEIDEAVDESFRASYRLPPLLRLMLVLRSQTPPERERKAGRELTPPALL